MCAMTACDGIRRKEYLVRRELLEVAENDVSVKLRLTVQIYPKRRHYVDILLLARFALSPTDAKEDVIVRDVSALYFCPIDALCTAIEPLNDFVAFDKTKLDKTVKFLKE